MAALLKKFFELVDGESGRCENRAECPAANAFVVGNNDAGGRVVSPKHHVASALAAKPEAYPFKGLADLPS